MILWVTKAQSVYRLVTAWTVLVSNPGGGEIFRTPRPTHIHGQWAPCLFPGGKAAGS